MDTSISLHMHADPATVFQLAAAVEDWPRILPHYRWVRVLATHADGQRTVAMAARRDVFAGLAVPLQWTAIQAVDEGRHRIEFEHIHGITRGMQVAWTIDRANPGRAGKNPPRVRATLARCRPALSASSSASTSSTA